MNDLAPKEIRRFGRQDSYRALTGLLHLAYQPLAQNGMHYLASHQSSRVTRRRARRGECYVVGEAPNYRATITLYAPGKSTGCSFYRRNDVASFHQFAVHPSEQGKGLGRTVLTQIEARAAALGASELALDTSEHAQGLLKLYGSLGYRWVEYVEWKSTNYRSIVLSKTLPIV